MGYVARPRKITLRFDHEPGLVIEAHSVPLSVLLGTVAEETPDPALWAQVQALATAEDADADAVGAALQHAVTSTIETGIGGFLAAVDSWNLEDENGTPVPITVAGAMSLPDPSLIRRAAEAWRAAMTQVKSDSPLPQPSSNGATLAEGSLPMAPLSAVP